MNEKKAKMPIYQHFRLSKTHMHNHTKKRALEDSNPRPFGP